MILCTVGNCFVTLTVNIVWFIIVEEERRVRANDCSFNAEFKYEVSV